MKTFHCARTKCEAILNNVLGPFAYDKTKTELESVNYINLSTDASNRGSDKMMPVLARYFIPTAGIRVKLLELSKVKSEKSKSIADLLKTTAENLKIEKKIVGFCGDNCPTNFGSSERGGENNVYYHLKEWLPFLIGIGCGAHIAHNSLKSACEVLPIDIQSIVVKVYSHFYIYTVRVEELRSICEGMEGIENVKLLGCPKTRFLALGPAIERILKLFCPLKRYFSGIKRGQTALKSFFNDPLSKFWLMFAKEQVSFLLSIVIIY